MRKSLNAAILSSSLALTLFLPVFSSAAELKLAEIFADHAVLQRDMPVPVWGTAEAGTKVTVEFAGQTKSATAGADGKWRVKLDPMPASEESRTLKANGVTVTDVLVGEVWLASGQSNMGMTVMGSHNAAEALAAAADPKLRFFTVKNGTAAEPQTKIEGKWDLSTPDTAKYFSGAAYFFARDLRAKLKVPVAVLHSSWGGTPAQAWVSVDALRQEPAFANHLKTWDDALAKHKDVVAHPEKAIAYQDALKAWQKEVAPAFNAAMKEYNASKSKGPKPQPSRPEPANPDPTGMPSPSSRPGVPGVIFNFKIAPIATYAIRGALWYQGEANGGAGLEYRALLPRLITDWRTRWGQGNFPFLVVQLPGWNSDGRAPEFHGWPWVREAQLMASQNVPNTGLAITIDIGDPNDVHPKNKLDVGLRLARVARKMVYGEDIVHTGPIFKEAKFNGAAVKVSFTEVGSGLTIGEAPWRAEGVAPLPKDKLLGFIVAGEDRKWHPADAKIEGNTVVVSSTAVPMPVAVRYAWANSPECNLYNKDGLPASPFRSDDWPLPAAK